MGCYAGLSPREHLWPDWQGINPREGGKQWLKRAWGPTPGCGAGGHPGGRAHCEGTQALLTHFLTTASTSRGASGLPPFLLDKHVWKIGRDFFVVFVQSLGAREAEDVRNSTVACCEFLTEKGFRWQPSAVGRLGSWFEQVRSKVDMFEMMRTTDIGTGGCQGVSVPLGRSDDGAVWFFP